MVHDYRFRRDNLIRLGAVLSLVLLFFIILLKVDNMLPSFILAFVIYFLFAPAVNSLERMGLARSLSITILFSLSLVVLSAAIILVLPLISSQVNTLRLETPRYIEGVVNLIATTESKVNNLFDSFYSIDISQNIRTRLFSHTSYLFEGLPSFATRFLTVMTLAPFFAFFMLLDGRQAGRSLLALVPNNFFEMALNLLHQLSEQMGDFIRARLLEAAIVGLVVWLGLEIGDVRFAPLLALCAALFNLIPYIGPIFGAIPAFAITFINGGSGIDYLLLAGVYGFAQLIDIVFIIPLVVAKIVDLHPVTVVIVIIIGAQLLGVLGMIISIPVASAINLIVNSVFMHVVNFRK